MNNSNHKEQLQPEEDPPNYDDVVPSTSSNSSGASALAIGNDNENNSTSVPNPDDRNSKNKQQQPLTEFKIEFRRLCTEHHLPNDLDYDDLAQRLYHQDSQVLETIEENMTPDDFEKLKSDLMNNKIIQNMINSSRCETPEELLEMELTKIWEENKFTKIDMELRVKFIKCLLEDGIDQGMKLILPKIMKKHHSELTRIIKTNETIQTIVGKKLHGKLQAIKTLQATMFGMEERYSDQLFTEIRPINYDNFRKILEEPLQKKSLLDQMLPYILNKLKKSIDLSEICESEIFWTENAPLYGIDYKTIFICMLERYKRYQLEIVQLIKKLGVVLPFAYSWVVNDKLIMKIPLRAYSHCLAVDCPMVISLGSSSIGKSTLLNKIYSAQFITNRDGKISDGIDVIFSTTEFACGFTIFDVHGYAYEQKALLEVFFTMMPIDSFWILLQTTSVGETRLLIEFLRSLHIKDNQMICIVRDYKEDTFRSIKQWLASSKVELLYIRKVEENNAQFNANLAGLKENLFKLTRIGKNSRKPIDAKLRKESDNIYLEIENRIKSQTLDDIHIDFQDDLVTNSAVWTDEFLNETDNSTENLQRDFFKHVNLRNQTIALEMDKAKLVGLDSAVKQPKITDIDQKILNILKDKATTMPNEIVCKYNELFLNADFHSINELDMRVSTWQNPILKPLFERRHDIVRQLEELRTKIADLEASKSDSKLLEESTKRQNDLENEKQRISKLIDDRTINRDIFMRELLAIYSDKDFIKWINSRPNVPIFDKNRYINSYVQHLIKGNEIEIIDGDNNYFNYEIVSEILAKLEETDQDFSGEPPFVVSVIGPQSTGKSTLLNMLFGSNFQTSAGRCTKGLYASIFRTEYTKARTLMVLDTEGLLSIEKANEEYDKKLTLFSMACSQVMLINLNGEINSSMKKILTISLFVANQLRIFRTRPIIIFVLRNMMDLNINKQREMIDNVKKELKEVSELSKLTLNQVLDFKEEKAFFLMLSAFNKDFVYNRSEELFQKSTTNTKFARLCEELAEKVFSEVNVRDPKFKSLSDWAKQASEIWKTIDLYNDIIMIDSIKEINERSELSDIVTEIMQHFIEPNPEKTSFRSKLEAILIEQEKLLNDSKNIDCDVQQRFDNETNIFREKVIQHFDMKVQSKSYTVKLTNEYKDRLLSAITTCKTQALYKLETIKERGKLRLIIDRALIELQQQSEKQIVDWQKTQRDTVEAHKEEKKAQIMQEFKNSTNNIKKKTENEMGKSKKSEEEWRRFVMNQIQSVLGTIQVEKRFFSTQNLNQKAETTEMDNTNIIRLIKNKTNPHYEVLMLEKIPKLVQVKQSYRKKRQKQYPVDGTEAPTTPIYTEEHKSWLKTKWNEATQWIRKKFRFQSGSTRDSHIHIRTQTTNYPSTPDISDNDLSSEGYILACCTFHEIGDCMDEIQKEIKNYSEYQITCLKQNILQIESKITELNQKYLVEEGLEFTHEFGNEVIEYLYDLIVEKMFSDQETTYNNILRKFDEDINNLLKYLKVRLDSNFGDIENAQDMATKMHNNIKNICLEMVEIEYKRDLEEATYLNPDRLVEMSDKVFYETDGNFDTEGIYEYITNMIHYMKKLYTEHFDSKAEELWKKFKENYGEKYKLQLNNLMNRMEGLQKIFQNYTLSQSHEDHHKREFATFFKSYIEGNINNRILETYLRGLLNLTYHHADKELMDPTKVFQQISIPIYSIATPTIFLSTFIDKIEQLRKDGENAIIQLSPTADLLIGRDKIKTVNQQKALGCPEQCPYCGCKCTEIVERHDTHHSSKHRLMAFNGSFERQVNLKKGFVFDLCNSENTIRNSRWKENSQEQLSVRDSKQIRERMNEYAVGEGDVTITLAWWDSNDLDLHVVCPCGTELYFGNKKCPTCSGYLDLDMNVCCHDGPCPEKKCSSTKPTENVYFRPAKKGVYEVSVNYFSGPKGKAGTSSQFQVRVQTHANNHIQTFEGYVESEGEKQHVKIGDYEHSDRINFLEHVKKNFPSWSNIQPVTDKRWETILKKAWWHVAPRMSQFHGYENNTPAEFKNLHY